MNDMSDTKRTPTGPGEGDGGGPVFRPMPGYWIFAIVPFMLFQSVTGLMAASPLACSEFKQLLHGGKVNEVAPAESTVPGTLEARGRDAAQPGSRAGAVKCIADGLCPFSAVRVADPDLVNDLDAAHVRYFGQQHSQ